MTACVVSGARVSEKVASKIRVFVDRCRQLSNGLPIRNVDHHLVAFERVPLAEMDTATNALRPSSAYHSVILEPGKAGVGSMTMKLNGDYVLFGVAASGSSKCAGVHTYTGFMRIMDKVEQEMRDRIPAPPGGPVASEDGLPASSD